MKTSLSGNIKQSVEEYETLKKDLFDTTALLATLILGIIFLFFWSVPLLALLSLTLISAVAWTFGLTYWQIGYLNSQTAFLGSIVGRGNRDSVK
jgi:predicted RND superfamily exporter protein